MVVAFAKGWSRIARLTISCVIVTLCGCADGISPDESLLSSGVLDGDFNTVVGMNEHLLLKGVQGALHKGVLGCSLGQAMDRLDEIEINQALDSMPANKSVSWLNPNTGARYTWVGSAVFFDEQNHEPCRDYALVGNVNATPVRARGRACRHKDGNWTVQPDQCSDNKS